MNSDSMDSYTKAESQMIISEIGALQETLTMGLFPPAMTESGLIYQWIILSSGENKKFEEKIGLS